MKNEIQMLHEIVAAMKKEREIHEQGIKVCDYARTIADMLIGRLNRLEDEVIDIQQETTTEVLANQLPHNTEVTMKTNYKNIYHRKDGRWEYIKKINGVKNYLIASTKEKLLEKIKNNKPKPPVETKNTFIAWSFRWLEIYKQDLSPSSRDRYKLIIEKHMQPFFKDTLLRNLKQEQVQIFINNMEGARNKEYAFITIRQILKQAYLNKKISEDLSIALAKPKRHRRIRRSALTYAEQEAFLKELKNYNTDVQMFMLFSIILGTRRSETLRFKLEDINPLTKRIHINGTKTDSSDRLIKISDTMTALLRTNAQRPENQNYFLYNPDFYTKIIQEIFDKAKIRDKTLHDLRHTCATNLLYLGVADKFRQQYMGHANIVMTNDVYTNLQDDLNKEVILKLYNNLYPEF